MTTREAQAALIDPMAWAKCLPHAPDSMMAWEPWPARREASLAKVDAILALLQPADQVEP